MKVPDLESISAVVRESREPYVLVDTRCSEEYLKKFAKALVKYNHLNAERSGFTSVYEFFEERDQTILDIFDHLYVMNKEEKPDNAE